MRSGDGRRPVLRSCARTSQIAARAGTAVKEISVSSIPTLRASLSLMTESLCLRQGGAAGSSSPLGTALLRRHGHPAPVAALLVFTPRLLALAGTCSASPGASRDKAGRRGRAQEKRRRSRIEHGAARVSGDAGVHSMWLSSAPLFLRTLDNLATSPSGSTRVISSLVPSMPKGWIARRTQFQSARR